MRLTKLLTVAFLLGACTSRDANLLYREGVGAPCTPEDERQSNFRGYDLNEVNLETRSRQCETGVCLANHFQGRVSCPAGQTADQIAEGKPACLATDSEGGTQAVTTPVEPQCSDRPASAAVFCTCACAGNDPNGNYCACPLGFVCSQVFQDLFPWPAGEPNLGNSFCIPAGTEWNGETTCNVSGPATSTAGH